MVFGVRREHVVLVGAAGPASLGRVVSPARAGIVHGGCPVEGGSLVVGGIEVQVVGGECASVLGEVAVDALAGRVAGYGLEQRHGYPYRKSGCGSATSRTGAASSSVLSRRRSSCCSTEESSSRTSDASMASRLR